MRRCHHRYFAWSRQRSDPARLSLFCKHAEEGRHRIPPESGRLISDFASGCSGRHSRFGAMACNFTATSCVLWLTEAMTSLEKLSHGSNFKPPYALNPIPPCSLFRLAAGGCPEGPGGRTDHPTARRRQLGRV